MSVDVVRVKYRAKGGYVEDAYRLVLLIWRMMGGRPISLCS